MTTELATLNDYDFNSAQDLAQVWVEEGITNPDFPRLKVPSGGGTVWQIADDPSFAPSPELRGIVVAWHPSSRLYLTSFDDQTDETKRPDAWSSDGVVQVIPPETYGRIEAINAERAARQLAPLPYPSTNLAECPYNKFASDCPGGVTPLGSTSGKDNNDYRELFIVLSGAETVVPYQLSIPATSIKAWDGRGGYASGLGTRGIRLAHVETVLTLRQEKAGSKVYSVVQFQRGRQIDPAVKPAALEFSNGIKAFVSNDPFLLARTGHASLEAAPVQAALPAATETVTQQEFAPAPVVEAAPVVPVAAPAAPVAPAPVAQAPVAQAAPVLTHEQQLDAAFAATQQSPVAQAPVEHAPAPAVQAAPAAPAPVVDPAPAPVAQAAPAAPAPLVEAAPVAAGAVADVDF